MTEVGGSPIANRNAKSTGLFKWRQPWEISRQQGKGSFILKRGVLGWGGSMFTLNICYWFLTNHVKPDIHLVNHLVSALIGWPLGGFVFGLVIWQGNENRYLRAKERQDPIMGVSHGTVQE
jgi:hypothetical protein